MSNASEALACLRIEISENVEEMADKAIAALAADDRSDAERVYHRGGRLVRIITDDAGNPTIRRVAPATLYERLSAIVEWGRHVTNRKTGDVDWKPCKPPREVVAAVDDRGAWPGLRHLVAIVVTPVLRPDGTILQEPGYDAATGLLYRPCADFPRVADAPSSFDAAIAAASIEEVIADFPFASPADRSAYLAALVTLFARPAIKGNTPLIAVDASVRGSGKGKLIDTIGLLATGARISTTTLPAAEEEIRKKITTLILEGKPLIHWDNVSTPIGGDAIESLATSPTWQDRILGKNESTELPKHVVCFFSGNNLRYRGDTARRVLPIRLVPACEHPEDRADFTHVDLLGWVTAHRVDLVVAILTIIRAWVVDGRALAPGAFGSFEEWHAVVVSIVRWLGWPDPMAVREGIEERNDPTKAALVHIVENWQAAFGQRKTTARKIYEALRTADELRTSFQVVAGNDNLTPRLVGDALSNHKDRVVAGRIIKTAGQSGGVATWECGRTV